MKIKTNIKDGSIFTNRNETLVQNSANQTTVNDPRPGNVTDQAKPPQDPFWEETLASTLFGLLLHPPTPPPVNLSVDNKVSISQYIDSHV